MRLRPLSDRERSHGERSVLACNEQRREVIFNAPASQRKPVSSSSSSLNGKRTFTYDHVFPPDATQADVYDRLVEPIVDEVLQGYNCTVFAYGQTGTGKTHTMEGRRNDDIITEEDRRLAENAGIIPRAVKQIFDHLRSLTDEHSVRVSHLELYNEQLTDLLSADDFSTDSLRVYEDPNKGTFVQGLDDTVVRTEEEIFAVLDKSAAKRKTAETLMNKYSSRSHSIFSITIHIKESTPDGADLLKVGKLNLVDLAGSENVGRSGAVKGRAREAGNINQSLLTLGRVITALVDRHPHVPYRDSKLTRLLQESLGGRNKTCIIATVTPASNSCEETASTLDYAYRAKSIKNRPTVNQMIAKHVLLKEYTEEIAKLKRELDTTRSKNGVYLPPEEFEKMQRMTNSQSSHITDLETKTEEYERKVSMLKEKVERVHDALARDQKILSETRKTLTNTTIELRSTKEILAVNTQQRDENAYLVKTHVSTEKRLFEEGVKLQDTLADSLVDVESLHVRVDAKSRLEKENVQNLTNLQSSVSNQIVSIQQRLEQHRTIHKMSTEAAQDNITKAAGALESGIASASSQFNALQQSLIEDESEDNELSSKQDGILESSIQNSSTSLTKNLNAHSRTLSEKNAEITKTCESILSIFSRTETTMTELMNSIKESNDSQQATMESFTEEQQLALTAYEKEVNGLVTRQKGLVDQLLASSQQDGDAQLEALKQTKNDLLSRISTAMDNAIESASARTQQKQIEDGNVKAAFTKEVESTGSAFSNVNNTLSKLSSDLADTSRSAALAFHACAVDSANRQKEDSEHGKQDIGVIMKEKEALTTGYADTHNKCAEDLQQVNEIVGQYRNTQSTQRETRAHKRHKALQAHQAGLQEEHTKLQSQHTEICHEAVKHITENDAQTASVQGFTKEVLENELRKGVLHHTVLQDVHADEKPERKDWPARSGLERTRNHLSLLEELREGKGSTAVAIEDFGQDVERTPGRQREVETGGEDMQDDGVLEADDEMQDSAVEKIKEGEVTVAEVANASCDGTNSGNATEEEAGTSVLSDVSNTGRKTRSRASVRKIEPGIKKPSSIPAPRTRFGGRRGVK